MSEHTGARARSLPVGDGADEALISTDCVERLISRIVDREAGAEEWSEFAQAAAGVPEAWKRLACAQRDAAAMRFEIERAVGVADRVRLPASGVGVGAESASQRAGGSPAAMRLPWLGWAAAACVAAAWVTVSDPFGFSLTTPLGNGQVQTAGFTVRSSDDAYRAYLDLGARDGRVVGEVPTQLLLSTEPAGTASGYDVIFIRQIVERARVTDLYRFGSDERGGSVLVPFEERGGVLFSY